MHHTADLERALPDSRVVTFEGQGHVAMLMAARAFVSAVEEFLLAE
jgi:pimeloyl-ACP methyl ester carboxylesterase